MGPLISLIVILTLSVLITKIATEALVHTGLSKQAAKFQARSAFTGVGFTTGEAESVVNHPVRRKIILSLMLIGNVGIISAIASLMLTFVNTSQDAQDNVLRIAIITGSMALLWGLSKSKWVERRLVKIINKALEKFSSLKIRDYVELLDLTGDYEITVIEVKEGDWMENRNVGNLQLWEEGINLIGIQRDDGTYLGTPQGETKITTNDQLILYGRENTLKNLEKRKQDFAGDQEHEKAVRDQSEEEEKQRKEDKRSK
ncbi:MAG: TrkA C-terminal domain-containing protein [Tangfeifania sp.]